MKKLALSFSLLLAASSALADEADPVPEPPEIPPQVESGEVLEPEVTIIESDKGKIHQYSVNGRVYMVKIVPVSGAPYYLLDSDGDGELDVRSDHPTDIAIPQWVLFSW
ncbi:DUF2782 domain-containing protein [Solemya velesiana gill symbiont]|uniref:DUF2782 domain-containing protein n=1 Tax=Solemya velesiana gill symbiont TaxID=1918948 RepID=A0A1T2KWT4_9GAMM|nr:DUF2782 domain-containing protein [Solemya velesiana gill symbiont]OOZ37318.1 hypothetical protein BOW51_02805 [Solemya velesiana gill symbiont]